MSATSSGATADPARIAPLPVIAFGIACAAGIGHEALLAAMRDNESRLRPNRTAPPGHEPLETWVGRVDEVEATVLPDALSAWDSRATRLAWLGLQADGFADAVAEARRRHGASRIGLALGTSGSTIAVSEEAYRRLEGGSFPAALANPRLNTPHAVAMFVREALAIDGPCVTVSTACSSSAKVFAVGERWLRAGIVDAVVVGGVDALGASLLYGFHSLGLVSREPCRPFDARRAGISVGEAAGFALLERDAADVKGLRLIGHGEANDAHHMSSPHPEGLGAEEALDAALARAGLQGDAVEYVNLHGTASAKNDEVEAALFARRYGPRTIASATKGLVGHTMGASGIVEAAIVLLALEHGLLPGTANTSACDPRCEGFEASGGSRLSIEPVQRAINVAASHSFGFGGSNAVLLFDRGARREPSALLGGASR